MEKRLAGGFWTSQKRSLHEAKGLQEIKEKPMGKWFNCFVCEDKRNRSFRRFWHEYNYNLAHCRAHVAHHHHIFIYHSSLRFHTHMCTLVLHTQTICYLQVGSVSASIRRAAVVWNYGNLLWCSVISCPKVKVISCISSLEISLASPSRVYSCMWDRPLHPLQPWTG